MDTVRSAMWIAYFREANHKTASSFRPPRSKVLESPLRSPHYDWLHCQSMCSQVWSKIQCPLRLSLSPVKNLFISATTKALHGSYWEWVAADSPVAVWFSGWFLVKLKLPELPWATRSSHTLLKKPPLWCKVVPWKQLITKLYVLPLRRRFDYRTNLVDLSGSLLPSCRTSQKNRIHCAPCGHTQ